MPTPSGMPKVGESIWLKKEGGWEEVVVTRREGTAQNYTVYVKRADGKPWFGGNAHGRKEKIVTEVTWWVQQGTVRMQKP